MYYNAVISPLYYYVHNIWKHNGTKPYSISSLSYSNYDYERNYGKIAHVEMFRRTRMGSACTSESRSPSPVYGRNGVILKRPPSVTSYELRMERMNAEVAEVRSHSHPCFDGLRPRLPTMNISCLSLCLPDTERIFL